MQGSTTNDLSWIFDEVKNHSNALSKAIIAITISNIFQVFSTLFVMAVYNKVIPNESMNTLFSLAVGICVILTFDFLFKVVKSKIADEVCSDIEEKLGPKLYQKILAWDLQNVPSQRALQVLQRHPLKSHPLRVPGSVVRNKLRPADPDVSDGSVPAGVAVFVQYADTDSARLADHVPAAAAAPMMWPTLLKTRILIRQHRGDLLAVGKGKSWKLG